MVAEQTYVSAVFHLSARDQTTRRPPDFLLRHGAYLLSLPVPLVLFVDAEFEEPCRKARRKLGLEDCTRIITRPLEHFELAALIPLLPKFKLPENCDEILKETPWHQLLQYSKLDMVGEVIDINPFGTDFFAWIDFSIAHIAAPPNSLPAPSERIALLEILPVIPAEPEDRQEFYRLHRYRVAGGFLRGGAAAFLKFRHLFNGELAAALALRMRPNEEMLYAALTARYPELFEVYYGDYSGILANWDWPRLNFKQTMANAAFCRTHALWSKGLRLCLAFESGLRAAEISLDSEQTAHWLDEFYVAAWYGGEKARCSEIARQLTSLASTEYYQANAERLEGNLNLLTH